MSLNLASGKIAMHSEDAMWGAITWMFLKSNYSLFEYCTVI